MKYRLDNYISYDIDGLARLLFESKEYYIYIWIDESFSISALQVNRTVREKSVGRLDSRNLVFHFNKQMEKSSISNFIIEIFKTAEVTTFKKMFSYLCSLEPNEIIKYKLDIEEIKFFEDMPSSKHLSSEKLRDAKTRRPRKNLKKWSDTFFY